MLCTFSFISLSTIEWNRRKRFTHCAERNCYEKKTCQGLDAGKREVQNPALSLSSTFFFIVLLSVKVDHCQCLVHTSHWPPIHPHLTTGKSVKLAVIPRPDEWRSMNPVFINSDLMDQYKNFYYLLHGLARGNVWCDRSSAMFLNADARIVCTHVNAPLEVDKREFFVNAEKTFRRQFFGY